VVVSRQLPVVSCQWSVEVDSACGARQHLQSSKTRPNVANLWIQNRKPNNPAKRQPSTDHGRPTTDNWALTTVL
jgi:hypothetical protein